jgi:trans-aconitate methyltransferase
MTEWKLFDGQLPEPKEYLVTRERMDLEHQPGFTQRAQLVCDLVALAEPVISLSDLGCGDGALLDRLRGMRKLAEVPMWGYDLGQKDLDYGRSRGLDLRFADITRGLLDYGELVVASEVAEHLEDPEAFLRHIPAHRLIVTSPSAETGEWHNDIHAWAWDVPGYANMVSDAGWTIDRHVECDGGQNSFGGVIGTQRFQAIYARR